MSRGAELTGVWYNGLPEVSFGYPQMSRMDFHRTVHEIHKQAREAGNLQTVMRRNSEYSLFYFVVYVLHWTFLDNDFAYSLCCKCQGKGRWGRMWLLAREHYKSTVITIAETIRDILIHPEETTVIYSYKFDSAKDLFFKPIKDELEHNQIIHMVWPDVVWGPDEEPDVWTATALNVKRTVRRKEFTLTCGSIFSQLTGYHADKLLFDDCVIEENCQTADRMAQTQKQWELSLNTGNTSHLQYCVIGTFYAYGDLYCHIRDENLCEVILQPCYDANGRGVLYSNDALAEKRRIMGSAVFATQMLLDPKQGAVVSFKEEDLRYWKANTLSGLNVYTFVDPAGEPKRKRDNTVIITLGLDNADNFYIIDIIRDKLTLSQRTDYLFSIKRNFSPTTIFYEQNAATTEVPHIQEVMDIRKNHFDIQKITQQKDKGMRIEALIPVFEAHRIWFREGGCWHTNWEGKSEDMQASLIKEELLAYPHVTHDDGIDDLANILHPVCQSLMHRPDTVSMEEQLYNKLKGKDPFLRPFATETEEEYDPFDEYRQTQSRGPWSGIYDRPQKDDPRSYGFEY